MIHRRDPVLARLADHDDPCISENLEVMGDRRLGKVEELSHLAARKLTGGGDLLHHMEPLPVRQRFERPDDIRLIHRSNISKNIDRLFQPPPRVPESAE